MNGRSAGRVIARVRARRPPWALALLGGLCLPAVLAGQDVRGLAVDAGTGAPIEGAFVTLLDPGGAEVGSTLTDPSGAYRLPVARPGRYRLRVQRIGYETWTSEPFEAGPGRLVQRRLAIPVRPVDLGTIEVAVEPECTRRPGMGPRLLAVWEEARKALEVTRWTAEQRRVRFELLTWEREEYRRTGGFDLPRGRWQREHEPEWRTGAAFESLAVEVLADSGYVWRLPDGFWFFGPDADVILSDLFQERHCFWLVEGEGDEEGLVGLAFEPVPRLAIPNVAGTLWLERSTAELRHLEYRYTDLDMLRMPRGGPAGGRVEFRRLPTGEWFVPSWWIDSPLHRRSGGEIVRVGERRAGGDVTRLALPGGDTLSLVEWGTLAGAVTDGRGRPLPGAEVRLAGTERSAVADDAGRFRFELVPPGRYWAELRHPDPRLRELEPPPQPVDVEEEGTPPIALAWPAAWALERVCREDPRGEGRSGEAAILGSVRDAGNGGAAPGATVWLGEEGTDGRRRLRADSSGTFLLCGLETPATLEIQASTPDALSERLAVELDEPGLVLRDLEVSAERLERARAERRAAVARDAALRGRVTSGEGAEPVVGARVRVLEVGREAVTGPQGAFFLDELPGGRLRVVAELLGMTSDTATVELAPGSLTVASFALRTDPVRLPELRVAVEREVRNPRIAGFYGRMQRGLGDFISHEELRHADLVSSFRRVPGVRVSGCGRGAFRDSNCYELSFGRGYGVGTSACRALVYLDGHLITSFAPVPGETTFSRLQSIPPERIEGIEIYRNPAAAPAQYRAIGDACGIVLVWTRGR